MQCLPRIALSPSAVAVQQLRSLRLLPSLLSDASSDNGGSAQAQSSSDIMPSYDMVIAGGGPVSTALACSIGCEPSLSHKQVLLLQPPSKPEESGASGKVSVLLQSSIDLLKRIGVWPEMMTKSVVKPFKSIRIWDGCSDAHVVFNRSSLPQDEPPDESDLVVPGLHGDEEQTEASSPSGDDSIGYIICNQSLMSSLMENLASYDNVQLETETKAKVIKKVDSMSNSLVQIMLDNGRNVSTNLLVGSDGPHSRIRQLCGLSSVGWSHDQWAFTATVEVKEAGRNATVWQRLLPTGPITMLPLSETTSALLWCTSGDHAQSLLSMTDSAAVVDAINAAFFDTLPQNDLTASVSDALRDTVRIFSSEAPPPHQLPPLATELDESSRAAAPLALAHAPNYVKDRIVLIGDASHQIHPLTGLGLSLGLGDVTTLTERLLQANSRGDDWGGLEHLLQYETERQRSNVPAMAYAEGLNWLYTSTLIPFILLRSIGLSLTNACPPVKDYIVRNTW